MSFETAHTLEVKRLRDAGYRAVRSVVDASVMLSPAGHRVAVLSYLAGDGEASHVRTVTMVDPLDPDLDGEATR